MEGKVYTDFKLVARGSRLSELLETAVKLGYRRVAIDVEVQFTTKKTVLPHVKELDDLLKETVTIPKGLDVLKRITVSLNDPNLLHHVQGSKILEGYDITALHLTSEKVFLAAVSCISTDIVSLEWSERLGFPLRHTQVSQILKRGTCFEVCYTPAIKDATYCRYIISNINLLTKLSKGKGIIVSSGAEQLIELRGPLDVINLYPNYLHIVGKFSNLKKIVDIKSANLSARCHLFGLKEEHCKSTITTNCLQVLSHAKQRTSIVKGAILCTLIEEKKEEARNEEDGKGMEGEKEGEMMDFQMTKEDRKRSRESSEEDDLKLIKCHKN